MSTDIAFNDENHDNFLDDNNDLALVTEGTQAAQHVKIRLWSYLGEWFLDITVGTPYFQSILGKIYRPQEASAIIRNRILNTPGVDSLTDYNFSLTNRNLSITGTIIANGESSTFSISEAL